jgi:hypothetical protein
MSIKTEAISFIGKISSAGRKKRVRKTEVIEIISPEIRYPIVHGTNEPEHH